VAHDSQPLGAAKQTGIELPLRRGVINSILVTLQEEPLGEQIVLFLLENETAMDSAKGIANWWVHHDELAVQAALDRLIACGVITPHTFASGTLYGLTRSHEIRHWLRSTYRPPSLLEGGPPGDGNRLAADSS
jgi:hypothetical protein